MPILVIKTKFRHYSYKPFQIEFYLKWDILIENDLHSAFVDPAPKKFTVYSTIQYQHVM